MRRAVMALLVCLTTTILAADRSLHLPVGDTVRKDREAALVLDAISDCRNGESITPRELVARLDGTRLIFVGESHTSMGFHLVQKRIIEELHRAGKRVLIGLEMYPYTEQRYLDEWSTGLLTENGFVQLSRWYKNWGYHWNYYRDIFLFSQANGIRMFAINAPREVVSAVRKKGFKDLTAEEAAHIPQSINTSNAEHYTLFKSFFEEAEGVHSSMDEVQWRSMFEAQCTWDATMAFNAVRALKADGNKDSVMVVLIGSGHVAYGLGIERQASQWFDGKMASVIPIPVVDDKNKPVDKVQASYANFIWGLPPEKDPMYPDLGVSTVDNTGDTRRKVLSVSKDSVGKAAGVQVGDLLIAMDGTPIADREMLNQLMAEKRWGDAATIVVKRGDSEVTLKAAFRRRRP